MRYLLIPLIPLMLVGCSDSEKSSPIVQDQPRTANTAQVAYSDLVQTGDVPTLADVFITGREYFWICGFSSADFTTTLQTVSYFYADGTGETVYTDDFGAGFGLPEMFDFQWSGFQQLNIISPEIGVTLFNFSYETDPDNVLGRPIYDFIADISDGGFASCQKNAGQWEDL